MIDLKSLFIHKEMALRDKKANQSVHMRLELSSSSHGGNELHGGSLINLLCMCRLSRFVLYAW